MEGHDILNTFLRFRDQLSIVISTSMMMDALCVVNRTALLRITKCRVKRHCSHRTGLLLLLLGSHRFLLICMDGELSRRREAEGFIVAICCCIQPGSGQSKHEAPLGE